MKAVGADHVVAIDADEPVAVAIGDVRRVGFQIVRGRVLDVVNDIALHFVAGFVEVSRQLGLTVDDDRTATRIFVQIDAVHHAVVGDIETLVNLAFAVHPLAALRLTHQRGEAMLQNARANSAQDIVTAVLFEDDGVDALEVQKLRQQKPRRPAADDANLDLHFVSSNCRMKLPDVRKMKMDCPHVFLHDSNMKERP